VRAAVRVVFQALDLGRDAVLVAAEIDDAQVVLVAAALVARGDAAEVVTAAAPVHVLGQRPVRLALVQLGRHHLDEGPASRRSRFYFDERHGYSEAAKLISWPSARRT